MNTIIFIVCMVAVTVYLTVAAIEDYRTCEVTRWKHLIGFVPGLFYFVWNVGKFTWMDIGMVIGFAVIFVAAGLLGVYGLADGFVLANLTFWYGGIAGAMGSGMVVVIMVLASFSVLFYQLLKEGITWRKWKEDKGTAFIPHILMGYVTLCIVVGSTVV